MTMLQEPTASLPKSSASTLGDALTGVSRRTRVAVVDDDDEFRCTLGLYLSDEGIEVIECPGSQVALERLSTTNVDVILLDWRMPYMNGLELLRELRQRGVTTPAIFLTGLTGSVRAHGAAGRVERDVMSASRASARRARRDA